jgi:uncharacterized protein (TIGR03435 family)
MRKILPWIVVLELAAGIMAPAVAEEAAAISFEVTSVKLNTSDAPPHAGFPMGPGDVCVTNGGRFNATGYPLTTYLFFAYKLPGNEIEAVTAQLPGWASTDRYDIEARTDGDPKKDTKDQMRLMMRSLLADRFRLKTHYETRQVSIYAMELMRAGKTGPQLQLHSLSEAESPCAAVLPRGSTQGAAGTVAGGYPSQCGGVLPMTPSAPGRLKVGARNVTMDFLEKQLPALGQLERSFVDRTGLNGPLDFTLEWVPDVTGNSPAASDFTPDPNGPSFAQALKDQLGLKLDSQKGTNQVLVIDHVERPSGN